MWIFSLDSQNGNGWNNCRPNIPSDNRKLLSDLFLSRRQNIPQNIVKLILRKGKQFWISWFLKFVANQLIFYISHLGKNINLLWFQLSRNFPSENIIEMHGNANWGGDKVLLEFFSPRIIRVWQRCDRCRSYHAREAGCASHKINLFPPTFQSFWNDLLDDGFTSKPIAFIRLQSFRGNPRLCLSVNGDQHLSFQIL